MSAIANVASVGYIGSIMDMRVRITELMNARGLTGYQIANASDKRITMSTIYRLIKTDGRMEYLNTTVLEALCDVFGVGPGELLERDHPAPPSKRRRKAAA